jgi:L-alanine-DL-glutamate epimerase-like enolase superfamily enzyme
MKIVAVRAFIQHMGLTKPYVIAYNTFTNVSIAFLEIELANGIIGYGTGSPAEEVVGETTYTTLTNLESYYVQTFIGRDIRHFQQLIFDASIQFSNFPGTLAAIDIALHDAFGKWMGISIAQFYGQKIQSLPTSVTIGIKNVEETIQDAIEYKKLGFTILKVKTGIDVKEDIERIRAINTTFGNFFTIRVDANQGYSINDLEEFINATKNWELELIEQPLKVGKEKELQILNEPTRKILCGDESLKNTASALQFAANKTFGIYNIKLMKCGGLISAKEIATIAKNGKIDLFWGCNDESIISITAALHIAYSCSNTKYLDLDGSLDLAEDIVKDGFVIENGHMKINPQPGFGFNKI